MEFRQLVTFRTLAASLSFTNTASALNYAQSSVTAQIQALETELGVALFDRLGKRVALTDAGSRFLAYAEKILTLSEEARTTIACGDDLTGTLTVSASETLCTYRLPPVFKAFKTRHPNVQLQFRPSRPLQLRSGVVDGILDVAFMIEQPSQTHSLIMEQLIREPLIVIAAPGHPLTHRAQVRPADLEHETILYTEQGCHYRNMFEQALLDDGVYPRTQFEFNSVEAIKECVMIGLGISVLPAVVVRHEIASGRLAALNWTQPDFQIYTQMVYHKDKWLSPVLAAFLALSRELLTQPALVATDQPGFEPA